MSDRPILVLGGGGMLGHRMVRALKRTGLPVACTLRGAAEDFPAGWSKMFAGTQLHTGVDLVRIDSVTRLLEEVKPSTVINCVGVIKQRSEGADPVANIAVNALAPHVIARTVQRWGGRLIHVSTDCVFEGSRGNYSETDPAEARDIYGLTKMLGEPSGPGVLTLRTSMVGREIRHHESLLEWLISQNHGRVRGFTKMFWSGVTNIYLADFIVDILKHHQSLEGLYHLSGERVSKHELLVAMRDALGLDVEIVPEEGVVLDRSLDGAKLRSVTKHETPPLRDLLAEIAADAGPYPQIA